MKIISTIRDFRRWRKRIGGSTGFVPTMGALHDGHLSLVEESNNTCQHTVVSIYLNPAQFGSNEDLKTYPQSLESDLEKLKKYQVDLIFVPKDSEIYPDGFSIQVQEKKLSVLLEGKSRPVFFTGITTVITKLFNIIQPSHAFFGEKDAQQLCIIKKLVKDLNYPITIVPCPIIREENGLAMSSRNSYLSPEEQSIATAINKALQAGKNLIKSGERDAQLIRERVTNLINAESILRIDYVSVAESDTLLEIGGKIKGKILVSVAVYLGKTRLIDNFSYKVSSKR